MPLTDVLEDDLREFEKALQAVYDHDVLSQIHGPLVHREREDITHHVMSAMMIVQQVRNRVRGSTREITFDAMNDLSPDIWEEWWVAQYYCFEHGLQAHVLQRRDTVPPTRLCFCGRIMRPITEDTHVRDT